MRYTAQSGSPSQRLDSLYSSGIGVPQEVNRSVFLGRSTFLPLNVNDVMASNMDLWATLVRVQSIQKGNSTRQYVMDLLFGMDSY